MQACEWRTTSQRPTDRQGLQAIAGGGEGRKTAEVARMTVDAEWNETVWQTEVETKSFMIRFKQLRKVKVTELKVGGEARRKGKRPRKLVKLGKKETLILSGQRWRFIVCLADLIGVHRGHFLRDPDNEGHVTLRLQHGLHVVRVLGSVSPLMRVFLIRFICELCWVTYLFENTRFWRICMYLMENSESGRHRRVDLRCWSRISSPTRSTARSSRNTSRSSTTALGRSRWEL